MKLLLLQLVTILLVTFSVYSTTTTIPLNRQKISKQQKLLQQIKQNTIDKELAYLTKQFIPSLKDVQSIPEIQMENHYGFQYSGPISVGTPGQTFMMLFSTASSQTWVPAVNCTGKGCNPYRPMFNSSQSSTYKSIGEKFKVVYGGGPMYGYIGKDLMQLGGKSIQNAEFAAVNQIIGIQNQFRQFDGVFGLSPTSNSNQRSNPITLGYQQGKFESNSFAIYLENTLVSNHSALTLGGVDQKFAAGNFTYHKLLSPSIWSVNVTGLKIRRTNISMTGGVIQSGTSFFYVSLEMQKQIVPALGIPWGQQWLNCSQVDNLPPIIFQIDGVSYPLDNSYYINRDFDSSGPTCEYGFYTATGQELYDFGDNSIVIGDLFFRKYYSHYDFGTNGKQPRVGFTLANHNNNNNSLHDI